MNRWQLLRDVALTGTAIFVIVTQVYSAHPSDVLLAVALGLTAPSVADHARALLSAHPAQSGSPPAPPREPPPSQPSSSQGGTGE